MTLRPRHLAWLAMLALIFWPVTGLCSMQASASAATAEACPMGGADGASCCCADACDSHSGTDHPNPSDKCPQIQSSDDHWTPGPRVTVDRNLLPAVQWMMLPGAFEPESVRQGRAGWAVTYRPLIPPEAKNSLLAQGCALNT